MNSDPSRPDAPSATDFCFVRVTSDKISVDHDSPDAAGARVDFLGIVRPTENDHPIRGIDYSHHPRLAQPVLERIARAAALQFPILGLTLIHRVGFVPAREVSLFLRIDAAHRDAAYAASRHVIEELKARAPIWKTVV